MSKIKKGDNVQLLEDYCYAEVARCTVYLKAGNIGRALWVGDDRSRVIFGGTIFAIVPNGLLKLKTNEQI